MLDIKTKQRLNESHKATYNIRKQKHSHLLGRRQYLTPCWKQPEVTQCF